MSEILEEIFEKGRAQGEAKSATALAQMASSLSQRDADNARMKDEIARLMAENAALKKAARL